MTNVFNYFGIQDVRDLAARVQSADPGDLERRGKACTKTEKTVDQTSRELNRLASELEQGWTGSAANAAISHLRHAANERSQQARQLRQSASAFQAVADAIWKVKASANNLVSQSDSLGTKLDDVLSVAHKAIDVLSPGMAVLNWGVKQISGVDLQQESDKIIVEMTRPILDEATGILDDMQQAIRAYETVLRQQGSILRAMPGVVRKDAGPVDLAGDADLRRGALFRSVYGRDPVTKNDKLMAEALDMQGDDAGNIDPNSRVVVMHIKPVQGAGLIYGSAFILAGKVFDPHSPNSIQDLGDGRAFDPNADPSQSRVGMFVDYDNGIVVVRQNASHTDQGNAAVGDPSVGVEQDPSGRVRMHIEAANPLAPQAVQDAHVSVRGDMVIDPHGGSGVADANGEVTRFPSWELYQRHDDGQATTLLQRHENDLPGGVGPMVGLPQPTVPVGHHPGVLDHWRHDYHPGQGHESGLTKVLQFPATRGDNFFQYPVGLSPYPSIGGSGNLNIPSAHQVP